MYKKICITNRKLVGPDPKDFLTQINLVCNSGVDMLILREKDLSEDAYRNLAKQVLPICQEKQVLAILHTHVDAACSLNHRHIHLTMEDFRRLYRRDTIYGESISGNAIFGDAPSFQSFHTIGVSTHTVAEAVEAAIHGATYITASNIYETDCKIGLPGRGLDYLHEVSEALQDYKTEVYALGGIHETNIHECIHAGADGVCQMSDYMYLGRK